MTPVSGDSACVFCGIVAGRVEAAVVYEDERALAFMDLQPVTRGHVLVIPKAHASHLEDLDEELGSHVFRVAHRLALALRRSGLPCDGVNLFLADGEAAFQEIFHVHLHVFPRTEGDGFRIEAAEWRSRQLDELEAAATQVRRGLNLLPPASL